MKELNNEVEDNIKENKRYLKEFKNYLENQSLSKKTINKHYLNVELYLNNYLNYYEPRRMHEGIYCINEYLGGWYIRKCLFATRNSIKESSTSIKKFYKCMLECGYVKKEDYDNLCETTKMCLDEWLDSLDDYDNGDYFYFI